MRDNSSIFINRKDAGNQLADALVALGIKADIVLALPRGGVPVGLIVAEKLGLPIKLYLVRKIGHPFNDEYAMGAVSENDWVLNESEKPEDEYINNAIKKERKRIAEMKEKFGHVATEKDISGKRIVLVDDGIATGTCITLAINTMRKSGAREIVVASPVCPSQIEDNIRKITDKLIVLKHPVYFTGIGAYYANFAQLTDNQVVELMKRSPIKATQ
jgi:putative phosphoribosyl transferase